MPDLEVSEPEPKEEHRRGPVPLVRQPARARLMDALGVYAGVAIVLVGICIFFAATTSGFVTYNNLINMLTTNGALLIVATGLTFSMLCGGFDLSVGGVLVLAGVVFGKLINAGVPLGVSIAIVIAGGVAFGALVNGVLIAVFELNFFVVVLGTNAATLSLALELTNGQTLLLYGHKALISIGNGTVATVPITVIIAFAVLIIGILVARYSGFGRMMYAVGGNAEASRIAGINIAGTRMTTYAISGGLAATAGVLEASRLGGASPSIDPNIALNAGAAVLLGGLAFGGGSGTLLGTFLGVMFLGVLQNGLLLSSISVYWQGVITGAVLIASVGLDRIRRIRRANRRAAAGAAAGASP